jgi:hypothetical protein
MIEITVSIPDDMDLNDPNNWSKLEIIADGASILFKHEVTVRLKQERNWGILVHSAQRSVPRI